MFQIFQCSLINTQLWINYWLRVKSICNHWDWFIHKTMEVWFSIRECLTYAWVFLEWQRKKFDTFCSIFNNYVWCVKGGWVMGVGGSSWWWTTHPTHGHDFRWPTHTPSLEHKSKWTLGRSCCLKTTFVTPLQGKFAKNVDRTWICILVLFQKD